MKRLSARLFLTLCVFGLAAAGHARADYLNWTYSTNPSVPGVSVGAQSPGGGATVALTDFSNQAGGTSIPVIAYVTSTAVTSPITFDPKSSTYTMSLTITDNATHDSGTLTFTGAVGGTLTATTSTLTNSFVPSPNTLTLDGHVYTVTIPTVSLAPPTSPQQNILARVSITDVNGGGGGGTPPPVQGAPEPTTLVLAGLALSLLGAGPGYRRLRLRLQVSG